MNKNFLQNNPLKKFAFTLHFRRRKTKKKMKVPQKIF